MPFFSKFVLTILGLIVVSVLFTPFERERVKQQSDRIGACAIAEKFVKDRLKAPATASFPWSCNATEEAPGTFAVTGYVDAQNGFGALIRTHYVATVKYSHHDAGGNSHWRLIRLTGI